MQKFLKKLSLSVLSIILLGNVLVAPVMAEGGDRLIFQQEQFHSLTKQDQQKLENQLHERIFLGRL